MSKVDDSPSSSPSSSKRLMHSDNALQLDLGAAGLRDSELRDVIVQGPFLAVPAPKADEAHHNSALDSDTGSERSISSAAPSPSPQRPPLPEMPSSAYMPSHAPDPIPPRVRFRSRVRIRGKRRSSARQHSADSSGSGSRSSTVSVPLDAHPNRRVLGLRLSAITARAVANANANEQTPLLPEELRKIRQAERRERRAMEERQREIDEELAEDEEVMSWKEKLQSRFWWKRRVEDVERVVCACCPESDEEDEEDG
ncbi:unnamed protein product [Peniophora sp. CBMAI 1063]|nr:unnamed protein product [Peniophora sp. CBMAI 1063]